jgi:hypothetical protein
VADAAQAQGPILETLAVAGFTDVHLTPAAPGMEDLFVQIVRTHGG